MLSKLETINGGQPSAVADSPFESLVCRQVWTETTDVKTFMFGRKDGRPFNFLPGQFITLHLTIAGQSADRCYTVSSSPAMPATITLTVKRTKGGLVSNWLHDTLRAGSEVHYSEPGGVFTFEPMPRAKYLFLSAGVGITPLMSMLRYVHDMGLDADISLIHSSGSPSNIVFQDELEILNHRLPSVQMNFFCTQVPKQDRWAGLRGRLTEAVLRYAVPDYLEREIFACGPQGYLQSVQDIIRTSGFDLERYHEELFVLPDPATDGPSGLPDANIDQKSAPAVEKGFAIQFTRSGREAICQPGQTVLDTARSVGIMVATSCKKGLCGTCKSRIISGEVEMKHAGGIRPREIAQGLALVCCSKPKSDLVVDL